MIKRIILLSLLIAVLVALSYQYRDQLTPQQLKIFLDSLGMWAPIIFISIYAIGTIALLPGTLLTLSGGAIFGPVWGTVYNMIGAISGATLAFIIARYLARDWVKKITGKKINAIMSGIKTEGWRFVALTRLAPIVPFNVLNYALGVSEISFVPYFLTTAICIFPACAAYTYLGYVGLEAAQAKEGIIQKALFALFLLALAVYSKRILKLIRRKS